VVASLVDPLVQGAEPDGKQVRRATYNGRRSALYGLQLDRCQTITFDGHTVMDTQRRREPKGLACVTGVLVGKLLSPRGESGPGFGLAQPQDSPQLFYRDVAVDQLADL